MTPATDPTLTAALEEVRGALEVFKTMAEAQRKKAGDAYGYGCMGVVYADSDIKRCDAALATINAALGRVEG